MLIKSPVNVKWGENTLLDIENAEVAYEENSEDYEANSGNVYQLDKSRRAYVKLTLLATDIESLAAILPQYFVPEGGQLGDGSFVFDERGAIDITADDCDTLDIYNDLELQFCGDPGETLKLIHARTVIDSIQVGKLRKIVVKFIGEPEPGVSIMQIVGDQGEQDFHQLDNDELFLLDDGSNLIL